MKKAYIYPNSKRNKSNVLNPYIKNFMEAFSDEFYFINKENPSNSGILNLIPIFPKTQYIFLNWIENLPDRKGGLFQSVTFILLIWLAKFFDKKIIWTLHNKLSHYKKNTYLKKSLFKFILKNSHYIITHSSEGISYANKLGRKKNILFYHHPMFDLTDRIDSNSCKQYDILIWGTLIPYKGIDKFLSALRRLDPNNKYKILIAGKAQSNSYYEILKSYECKTVTVKNEFISKDELIKLFNISKSVLFTYAGKSVLSSGSLMDSLSYGLNIIGPDIAAFSDLKKENLIITYSDFDELVKSLDKLLCEIQPKISSLKKFIQQNTWSAFAKNVSKEIRK